MAAETNTILASDIQKAREIEFTYRFNDDIRKFMEMLGTTRMLKKRAGTYIQAYKAKGSLSTTTFTEGELIPLSKYEVEPVNLTELTIKKWRKQTTVEAIAKSGYNTAVGMTTDKMLGDVRSSIKTALFTTLANGSGSATGATVQAAFANAWAQLQVKYEDTDIRPVFITSPLTIGEYLGQANITLQNAFGMTYIENFLGLGTVILNSAVPANTIYATASENIVCYYLDMNDSDFEDAFPNFTKDATGLIAIAEKPDENHMTVIDTVVSGVLFFPERIDGIIVATIVPAA